MIEVTVGVPRSGLIADKLDLCNMMIVDFLTAADQRSELQRVHRDAPGNRKARMLRRDDGDRAEFIASSLWESVEVIRAFAGGDIEVSRPDVRCLVGPVQAAGVRR